MKIIGVELHTPTPNDLSALAVLSLIYIAAAFLLSKLISLPVTTLTPFLVGALSGTLAASCGCSILKYGVRWVILTAGFCVAMYGLCAALIYMIELL